jgi:DNA-binding MarR family transcriptional regulator
MRDNISLTSEVELLLQFKHAHQRLSTTMARRVEAATDVPAAQAGAVVQLTQLGPCLVGELGERLGLNSAGVTGLVSRLVQRGLVQREPDPHDRRAVRLRLTEHGREVAVRALPIVAECAKQLTVGLSEAETEVVTRFLTGVTQTFTEEVTR